jgi:hypothetical protein
MTRAAAALSTIALFAGAVRADQVFLREAEAPRALFGEGAASADRKLLQLSDAELAELSRVLERKVELRDYPYLEVHGAAADASAQRPFLGYVFLLEVLGQSQPISFAVAVKAEGTLQDIQVMVYREPHGDEIRERRFRAQFAGKKRGDPLVVGKDVDAITGATISSNSAAYAARKALALGQFLRSRAAGKAR